jgi:transcriptional regulator with AAA-type ATPase domain
MSQPVQLVDMPSPDRRSLESLTALATCNPFLPERVELERAALGAAFEEVSPVWSKRLDRQNPNVVKLAGKAEATASSLRERFASGTRPPLEDQRLYEELVFYVLYYRFEARLRDAMSSTAVPFYDDFCQEARFFLALPTLASRFERELPHWFAFLFQIRRASHHIFEFIVGSSLPAARLRGAIWQSIFTHDLRRYRRTLFDRMGDLSTLVTGPSGTGKELVARAIGSCRYVPFHPRQGRFAADRSDAFYPLNLSALAPTLIESELFGHRRGAFTGALADRKGWLSVCPKLGTVFLDEIGDLDSSIQVKLLRVLQTREFQPLGETRSARFEGKIVAATHRDLGREMQAGRFREDLYYRLCSDLITTPSLREQLEDRPEDMDELVRFLSGRIVGPEEAEAVTSEVIAWIEGTLGRDYDWPGNVRELEQCVRNVVVRKEYRPTPKRRAVHPGLVDLAEAGLTAEELIERYCLITYERTGSYLETARRLGLDRRTVKSKVLAFRKRQSR